MHNLNTHGSYPERFLSNNPAAEVLLRLVSATIPILVSFVAFTTLLEAWILSPPATGFPVLRTAPASGAAAGGRYVPKFMPPGMAAAMADVSAVKQEPMPPPAAASMGPPRAAGSDRKPRKIDMMLQTLKRCVPAGEPRHVCLPACVPCGPPGRTVLRTYSRLRQKPPDD